METICNSSQQHYSHAIMGPKSSTSNTKFLPEYHYYRKIQTKIKLLIFMVDFMLGIIFRIELLVLFDFRFLLFDFRNLSSDKLFKS